MMLTRLISFLSFMAVFHFSRVSGQFSFTQPATGPSSVCEGSNVTLQCGVVFNDSPRDSRWSRNGISVRVNDTVFIPNHNVVFNSTTGAATDLVITNVTLEDDNTVYTCRSTDNSIISSVVLNVSGPPSISHVVINEICMNDVMLSWNLTSDHDLMKCGSVSYNLTKIFNETTKIINGIDSSSSYNFTYLAPGTNYTVFIEPSNMAGMGQAFNRTIRTAPNITTVAAVDDICLTYIVIRIIQIDQMFCGGNVTYNTTVSPPNDQIKIIKSETMHKITGLTNNTNYSITTVALRRGGIIHQDIMNNSTLQSQRPAPVDQETFRIYPQYITNESQSIFINWTRPKLYRCIPDITKYIVCIIINGSTTINQTINGSVTSINMSDHFSPHPMLYNNYTAKIIVVNSEGESSATTAGASSPTTTESSPQPNDSSDNPNVTIIIIVIIVILVALAFVIIVVSVILCRRHLKEKVKIPIEQEKSDESEYTQANSDQQENNKDTVDYAYASTGPRGIVFPSSEKAWCGILQADKAHAIFPQTTVFVGIFLQICSDDNKCMDDNDNV